MFCFLTESLPDLIRVNLYITNSIGASGNFWARPELKAPVVSPFTIQQTADLSLLDKVVDLVNLVGREFLVPEDSNELVVHHAVDSAIDVVPKHGSPVPIRAYWVFFGLLGSYFHHFRRDYVKHVTQINVVGGLGVGQEHWWGRIASAAPPTSTGIYLGLACLVIQL